MANTNTMLQTTNKRFKITNLLLEFAPDQLTTDFVNFLNDNNYSLSLNANTLIGVNLEKFHASVLFTNETYFKWLLARNFVITTPTELIPGNYYRYENQVYVVIANSVTTKKVTAINLSKNLKINLKEEALVKFLRGNCKHITRAQAFKILLTK